MFTDLKNLSLPELQEWAAQLGEPRYRALQLVQWMYSKGVDAPDQMTNIPKSFREKIADNAHIGFLEPFRVLESEEDETRKFVFVLDDGECVESVLIPERGHSTLCVSTQVGCAMGCAFCRTGRSGLTRNLSSGEILNQILAVRRSLKPGENLTNLVFMGMGEPLANFDQCVRALGIITDNRAMAFGLRRVTVSTCGIADRIPRLGALVNVGLAVSLNAADDDVRSAIMPVNRKYPMDVLLKACREYPLRRGRRVTYEYVLIRDVNDRPQDAQRLARILVPAEAKINLIPLNAHDGSPFQPPDPDRVEAFQNILIDRHYTAIIRKSKGRDILAACGQLAGTVREKNLTRLAPQPNEQQWANRP